jgi:hypothetical protein
MPFTDVLKTRLGAWNRSVARAVARPVGQVAGQGAMAYGKDMLRAGVGTGAFLAGSAYRAAQMGVGVAYGGARLGMGAGKMFAASLEKNTYAVPKFAQGMMKRQTVTLPGQMKGWAQNALVGAAVVGAVGAGTYDYARQNHWTLTQALSTGATEIERPHFLGATGSLTIASSSSRRRRAAIPTPEPSEPMLNWHNATHMAHLADDVLPLFF